MLFTMFQLCRASLKHILLGVKFGSSKWGHNRRAQKDSLKHTLGGAYAFLGPSGMILWSPLGFQFGDKISKSGALGRMPEPLGYQGGPKSAQGSKIGSKWYTKSMFLSANFLSGYFRREVDSFPPMQTLQTLLNMQLHGLHMIQARGGKYPTN